MSEPEQVQLAAGPGAQSEAAEERALLAARARLLARADETEEVAGDQLDVIEFRQGVERYGVESRYSQEVCRLGDFTPVPCTPDFVLGIINVHGRIFSVIDLASLLGLPASQASDDSRVVILRCDEMEFGILVDEIFGLTPVSTRCLQPSLPTLTDLGTDFLKGVTADCLVILDAGRILSDPRLTVEEGLDASLASSKSEGEQNV